MEKERGIVEKSSTSPTIPSHLPPARAQGGAGIGHWLLHEAARQTLGHRPWQGIGRCPHH